MPQIELERNTKKLIEMLVESVILLGGDMLSTTLRDSATDRMFIVAVAASDETVAKLSAFLRITHQELEMKTISSSSTIN
jgi:hypothetical protein